MNKTVVPFLSLTLLVVATTGCTCSTPSIAPTEAPTEKPTLTEAPTEKPTPAPATVGPRFDLGDFKWRPPDLTLMVYVLPQGFTMGSTDEELYAALELCGEHSADCRDRFEREQPAHHVMLLRGFWIDRTEVTNGQYRQCVAARACEPPAESGSYTRESYYGDSTYDDYPVIHVSWHSATAYCEWAGARLPTEAEWEFAARGLDGRIFPWGDELDGTRLNYCDVNCEFDWADESFDDGYADTAPAGSYPKGASWCGALDLTGNVAEWTADWYGEYPSERQTNPTGPTSGERRVMRGGSWDLGWFHARAADRSHEHPDFHSSTLGFRCAASAE
jgi:formylglycine-generating enzyme required for sulfatase activity